MSTCLASWCVSIYEGRDGKCVRKLLHSPQIHQPAMVSFLGCLCMVPSAVCDKRCTSADADTRVNLVKKHLAMNKNKDLSKSLNGEGLAVNLMVRLLLWPFCCALLYCTSPWLLATCRLGPRMPHLYSMKFLSIRTVAVAQSPCLFYVDVAKLFDNCRRSCCHGYCWTEFRRYQTIRDRCCWWRRGRGTRAGSA